MSGHSQHAPSGAALWMGCAGALNRIKALGIVDDRTSIFAAEGTAAHWVREQCLEFGFEPYDFIGTKIQADGFDFVCDEEMADHLQPGIDRCREFEGQTIVEVRVNITPWVGKDDDGNDQGGTVDFAAIGTEEWVLNDLKYGSGVAVPAVGNKQQRIYGLGLLDKFSHLPRPKRIRIVIDQPRNSAGGGEWIVSIEDLLAFGEEVRAAAEATRDPDAPCTPSESACQWCPLARLDGACPEHESWKLDFLGLTFDDLDDEFGVGITLPDLEGITPARRRTINAHAPIIRKWLDRLHADEMRDVLEAGPSHGVKAVAGRMPPRKHKDEEASEAWLRKKKLSDDKIFTQKLISVAQLDKLLGKGIFPKRLVDHGDPKPVLVPIEDDRPALLDATEYENLDAADGFND